MRVKTRVGSMFLAPVIVAMTIAGCADSNLSGSLFNQTAIGTPTGTVDSTSSGASSSAGLIPGLPKGFQCPFIPNGFDPVGSVYRLDKKNVYYRVADLSNDPTVLKGVKANVKVGDYAFNDTQKASADLSVGFLKSVLPGLSTTANANKEFLVDISVRDMHAKVLYDTGADHIRDWFAKTQKAKAGNRYFLVREAIFAGSVSYELSALDLKKAGVKADIDKVVDASANVTFADNGRKLVIKQTFSPPTQVCIKVAEIEINRRGSQGAVAAAALKSTDQTTLPTIKRIGDK